MKGEDNGLLFLSPVGGVFWAVAEAHTTIFFVDHEDGNPKTIANWRLPNETEFVLTKNEEGKRVYEF